MTTPSHTTSITAKKMELIQKYTSDIERYEYELSLIDYKFPSEEYCNNAQPLLSYMLDRRKKQLDALLLKLKEQPSS